MCDFVKHYTVIQYFPQRITKIIQKHILKLFKSIFLDIYILLF